MLDGLRNHEALDQHLTTVGMLEFQLKKYVYHTYP